MRLLSAGELLEVWEQGQGQSPEKRALTLLTAGSPDIPEETFVRMPVGERDRQLLLLREQVFGPDLDAVADCPVCGGVLETTVHSPEIRAAPVIDPAGIPLLESGGYQVRFRLPDSRDLAAIAGITDVASAKLILLERCIMEARKGPDPVQPGKLPGVVLDAVLDAMEAADPQAATSLRLTCPACRHEWQEPLDILSFFWDEIDTWAGHTLDEVHLLATAYGWSESEVLSLSAARRQMYLEKVVE